MRRFFVFVVFCGLCVVIGAVPAKPIVKDSVLADGSVVQMVLRGDEFYHYYEQITDCGLQITDYRQQIAERRERAIAKRRMSDAQAERPYMLGRAPHQAERGLAILVEFSDNSFTKVRQNFDDLLNKDGYDYCVACDYVVDFVL